MGKIRVQDLAKMMKVEHQDLIFKLKSIGVRVDKEDAQIDTSVIEAILKGQAMPQPREVILRDEQAASTTPATPRRRPPASRTQPPARSLRRRGGMVQKVEPRIKAMPVTEKKPAPAPVKPEVTAEAAAPAQSAAPTAPQKGPARAKPAAAPAKSPRKAPSRGASPAPQKRQPQDSRRDRREAAKRQDGTNTIAFKADAPTEPITVAEGMSVREFAEKLGVKSKDLIKLLFKRGIMANINHVLEVDLAVEVAEAVGVSAMAVTFEEEVQLRQEQELEGAGHGEGKTPRGPVVTIMGHVDHGKTTLLDATRSSRITESEHGGITQHIGAYKVMYKDQPIVFVDTPGHEAFTLMRARGAKVTDIVILVVAADDSVMPQTIEAIDHARAADVPILVAINKVDKANANLDRVKKDLAAHGLAPEDWGGDTVTVPMSALNGEGVDDMLEMILLTAEILELKASPALPAQGIVIEARKDPGRGNVTTVLIQDGSLSVGDSFVSGSTWGRVRSMSDDLGERDEKAGPATPVEVTGFNELPGAGDALQVVEKESEARSIAEFRRQEQRRRELAPTAGKISLDQLFSQIKTGDVKELPIVLKADVQGSLEVLKDTLTKLSTDAVKIQIIHTAVGAITTNDVILASASKGIIIGFNVRPEKNAIAMADQEAVDLRLHTVIYQLTDEVQQAMTGLLDPTFKEVTRGRADVREIFSVPKIGVIAGCHVVEGVIPRNAEVRLLRDNVVVHQGNLASLRRFKEDASEVRTGFDCGIRLERYQDIKPGDVIEAFVQEKVAATL